MGTVLEISLVGPEEAEARRILERLYDEVAALEAALTVFDPESALSRFNRAAGSGPVAVPAVLAEILGDAVAYSERTAGSFDVTVGPLVALWTEAAERGENPTPEALDAARARVGARMLQVHGPAEASLMRPGMSVNLGGVAKGFALDRLATLLGEERVHDALLSFGQSSVLARGSPAGGGDWQLLLGGAGARPSGVIRPAGLALSVSESLGQWSEIGGRRYGHVVDPRSGRPLERAFLAAVVAPSAAEAEAWSKALLVLGEEGLALLEARSGAEGTLIDELGARSSTSGFDEAVSFAPLAP